MKKRTLPKHIEMVTHLGRETFRHREMFKYCVEKKQAVFRGELKPFYCSLFKKTCSSYTCHEGFGI